MRLHSEDMSEVGSDRGRVEEVGGDGGRVRDDQEEYCQLVMVIGQESPARASGYRVATRVKQQKGIAPRTNRHLPLSDAINSRRLCSAPSFSRPLLRSTCATNTCL